MKRHNLRLRLLAAALLLALCLPAVAACQTPPAATPDTDGATLAGGTTAATITEAATTEKATAPATDPVTDPVTEPVTEPEETTEEATTAIPDRELAVDSRYRIVVAADATELIRQAADKVAAAFREKAGLELEIVTDAEPAAAYEIVLGDTNRIDPTYVDDYALFLNGDSIHLDASGHMTLYYAVDAVLETWLSADFGLKTEGAVSLWQSRVIDLNGLPHEMTGSIKVMTQNLRNADDGGGNTIPKRFERLKLLLADYRPDIIGTQEHSTNWDIRLQKMFDKWTAEDDVPKYVMVGDYSAGPDSRGGGRNAIFYREDRFDLIETGTFWLSETPDQGSTMTGTTHKRTCTWAVLKDKWTDQTILAVNTHLDHEDEAMRVKQINVLFDYLAEKFSGEYPIFFTGDFNTGSWSETYGIVTQTFSDARSTAERNLSTVSGTFHGYREGGFGSVIDHIFHNDKATPITYEILSKDYGGFVSDHYGVMAEFLLK